MAVPKLMTLPETAALARITLRMLMLQLAAGQGPIVTKIGTRSLIREDHYAAWIEQKAKQPAPAAASSKPSGGA